MFFSVFGLGLYANQLIPGLVALPSLPRIDVEICLGSMPPWLKEKPEAAQQIWYTSPHRNEQGHPNLTVWKIAAGAYFRLVYNDGTEFIVDRIGKQVWATWPDALTLEDAVTYLLGPILGFLLRLRGLICLHASAIAIGDEAIALLGPAGAGKSTTAAAFAQSGYAVLSDDVVALDDEGTTFLVQPAYPRIRLWPASAKALYGAPDALPRLTPTWEKLYVDLTKDGYRFQQQALPLAAIYVLGEPREDTLASLIKAMPAQTGQITLIANTYTNYLLDRSSRAKEFELLSRIARRVPLRQVIPRAGLAHIRRLSSEILKDFQALVHSRSILTDGKQG